MRSAEFRELPKQTLEYQTMNETWPLPVCCRFYVLTDVHRRHRQLRRAYSHYYQSNGISGCIYAASVQFYYLACACSCFALLVHATFSSLSNTHIRSFDSLIQSLVFQSQVGKLSSFQTKLQSVEGLPQNMCGGVSAVRYCDRADRGSKPFESFCTTQKFLCQHFALLFPFFALHSVHNIFFDVPPI